MEKLANIYKRPLAVFFLPTPPREPPLPEDFRSLPQDQRKPFSEKTRLAIRRARRLQSLVVELAGGLDRDIIPQIGRASVSDDPEIVASRVREELGVEIRTQFSWTNRTEALDAWKKAVEKRGVFVFQIGMPQEDGVRAFSLLENKPPAIVLNLWDVINGRIFSLFHEYGHLLLNASGICNTEEIDNLSGEAKSIEEFCNHFAGAVLVPKDTLLKHELVRSKEYSTQWSDEILKELAEIFKVSQEVILRRLVIFDQADKDFYKSKREEWKPLAHRRGWGPPNPPKKCIQKNGTAFVSLVLDSHRKEKITYRDVADYLAIHAKYLPKIEQFIEGKV